MEEGLFKIFLDANAIISPPTCGPCLGGHMGILAPGEVAIATTNRNFTGRIGHPQSKVYLANPTVTAASAIAGRIVHPGSYGPRRRVKAAGEVARGGCPSPPPPHPHPQSLKRVVNFSQLRLASTTPAIP